MTRLTPGGTNVSPSLPPTCRRSIGRRGFAPRTGSRRGRERSKALFHSNDPRLDTNKQAAYHIVRDLLEAGHWELADKYLTERYIQHNPNAASGRDGVVKYFTEVRKVKPVPIPAKMKTEVVAVVAEGDLVVVAYVRALKDATTTWFDMWRFKDGKADEHWDPATRTGP